MNALEALERQEHLLKLELFCRKLADALRQAGSGPEACRAAIEAAVSAECVSCGIHVSGTELFALSQPPSAEYSSVKVGRLRRGDCARQGCDSLYYRLSFQPYSRLDWNQVLEPIAGEAPPPPPARRPFLPDLRQGLTGLCPKQVWFALALLLLVLLLRQWHNGGRIPLLREPEHFHVDPAPEEQAPG